MDDPSTTKILVLPAGAEGRRWADLLDGPQFQVWLGREAIPEGHEPDVIVACQPGPTVSARGEVGTIRLGVDGPADVHLPEDCRPRELELACRLLGRIVHLRRQERQSAEVRRELSAAAMTDPLTGLPNRRAWDVALGERMAMAGGSAELLCLAVLDLDRFKRLNDTLGHPAGDEALRATGRVIARSVRQSDFAARLGGEEFGLLLWVPDAAAAATVVRRVQARVSAALGSLPSPKVTASAGYAIASAATGSDSAQALFLAADTALREAKRSGRNRTVAGGGV